MKSPTVGGWRILRATTLGVSCALISVTGHLLGSFETGLAHIDYLAVGFIALLCTLIAGFTTESEFTAKRLATFVVSTQLIAHIPLSFRAGQEHGAHQQTSIQPLISEPATHSGHHGSAAGSALHTGDGSSITEFIGSLTAGLTSTATLTMLLAHIVAGVLIIWLLRNGEALLFRMHQQVPEFLKVLLGYATPSQPIRSSVFSTAAPTSKNYSPPLIFRLLPSTTDPQRGPPAYCA